MTLSAAPDPFASRPACAADGSNQGAGATLGDLPVWDLTALYPEGDTSALWADVARAEKDAEAFARDYQGSIEAIAAGSGAGARLAESVKRMEALNDLIGRIASYAHLNYVTDTADPARAKLLGDVQDKLTGITSKLVFYTLELNQLDDATLENAMSDPALAHYRPWLEDVRKEKPYQLSKELELLFHDKSATSRSAWSRLFNETISALRFSVDGEQLSLEPTLTLLSNPDEHKRHAAAQALAKVLGENSRLFTLVMNTLAKDKEISTIAGAASAGRGRLAPSEPTVSSRRWWMPWSRRVCGKYGKRSHRYYAMKARWLGQGRLATGTAMRPCRIRRDRRSSWDEAREIVLGAYHGFSPRNSELSRSSFSRRTGSTRRPGKTSRRAHSPIPACRAHPYSSCSTISASTRDVMTLAHELGHGVHQVLANAQGRADVATRR